MSTLPLIKTGNQAIDLFQTKLKSEIDPVLANFLIQGLLLKSIPVVAGNNVINHKLQRQPMGWVVVDQTALSAFYRVSWDIRTLTLNASQPAIIALWVF